jgi:hypothetical protein
MSEKIIFEVANNIRSLRDKDGLITLAKEALPQEVQNIVNDWLGKSSEDIKAEIRDQITEEVKSKVPEKYRFLFEPLGDLDDKKISVLDLTADSTDTGALKVSAAATASIELDGVLDESLDKVLEGKVPEDSALFTIALDGTFKVNATAAAIQGLASFSANFASEAGQAMMSGFICDKEQPVIVELFRIRDYFTDISDLKSVMASFAKNKNHRVLQRTYKSKASLGLKIGIEKDLSDALSGLVQSGQIEVNATAGASITVNMKDEDEFVFTVERDSASSAIVKLAKTRSQERSRIFKVGASIEFKGLKNELINQIDKLLPQENEVTKAIEKLDALIEEVDGGNLQKRLGEEMLAKWPGLEAEIPVLLGMESTDDIRDKLLAEFNEMVTDKVTEKVNVLSDDLKDKSTEIANDIVFNLAVDSAIGDKIKNFLSEATEDALSSLKGNVDEKLEELNSQSSDLLGEILGPFDQFGSTITDAINSVGDTATAELAKVRAGITDVYKRYTRLRQKLITVVQEKVTESVTLAIINESNRKLTNKTALSFRIVDADAAGVAELYEAMWSVRLDNLWALLPAIEKSSGIKDLQGSYVNILKNVEKFSFSLNVLGLTMSNETIFSSEVEVGIDKNNELIVAKTLAELKNIKKRNGEAQSVTAAWSIDYLKLEPALVPPLRITLEVSDNKLTRDDLDKFFSGLSKEGISVLKPDTEFLATNALFGNGDKPVEDVQLSLIVPLTWQSFLDLVGGLSADGQSLTSWNAVDVVRQLFANIKLTDHDALIRDIERTARRRNVDPIGLALGVGKHKLKKDAEGEYGARASKNHTIAKALYNAGTNLDDLQDSWQLMMGLMGAENPDTDEITNQGGEVDKELKQFLSALLLRSTMPTFQDYSHTWRFGVAARLLLDRSDGNFLQLRIEAKGKQAVTVG